MSVDVLKAREGNLTQTPFPVLLDAIHRAGLTCALELSLRQLRKRIVFDDGAPVECESNLLHETLGKRLVELGKLTEAQYQAALAESVKSGAQMGELLVQQGLVAPYELYRQLQASLAHKILDCFRWSEASYRLLLDAEPTKSALRMNPAKLVFTGVTTQLPFEIVSTQLELSDTQRFVSVANPPPTAQALKLAGKEQRFLQVLKGGLTFAELVARTQLELEPALRRLHALLILGLVERAEAAGTISTAAAPGFAPHSPPASAPASAVMPTTASAATDATAPMSASAVAGATAPTSATTPTTATNATPNARPTTPPVTPAAVVPTAVAFSDDDAKIRDALIAAFLEHRSRDPFALLGVQPDANALGLRQRFLELSDRFSPLRFATAELKEKAEALLVAHARAFGQLVDPEQRSLWEQRRRAAEEKAKSAPRPSTAEQFRIRTDLLDAQSQFAEGRKRLQEGNARGALEYFEYACDIEPKPRYRAWRAWARYASDPARHARLALQELSALMNEEGATDEVFALAGKIHQQAQNWREAEACFRRAYKLNPNERAYVEAIQLVLKSGKH